MISSSAQNIEPGVLEERLELQSALGQVTKKYKLYRGAVCKEKVKKFLAGYPLLVGLFAGLEQTLVTAPMSYQYLGPDQD